MTQDGALYSTNGLSIYDTITQDKWHVSTAECLILYGITIVSMQKFFITDALNSCVTDDKIRMPSCNTQSNLPCPEPCYISCQQLPLVLPAYHYYQMSMTRPGRTIYARKTQILECFAFSAVLKDLPPYSYLSYFFDRHPDLQVIDLKVSLKQLLS